jgi:hypothetical protein
MDMNPKPDRRLISRLSSTTICGLILIPLGAWAALAPYVAGGWAWEWHTGRFLLVLLPGAVAMLGGLVMLTGKRTFTLLGGALALAAGLWFIAGPVLWRVWEGGDFGTDEIGASVRLIQWVAFFFAAGAFISAVSAYALGLLRPLEFPEEAWPSRAVADESWTEPSRARRARVPLPTERPRRQRGAAEPGQERRARPKGSVQSDG